MSEEPGAPTLSPEEEIEQAIRAESDAVEYTYRQVQDEYQYISEIGIFSAGLGKRVKRVPTYEDLYRDGLLVGKEAKSWDAAIEDI
ncbi:MAG: hypothetical protein ACYC2Y_10915 [Armatimonadota bacterium]